VRLATEMVENDDERTALVKALVEKGADVNWASPGIPSALYMAADNEDAPGVRLLLSYGASPHARGWPGGETPLFAAAARGNEAIAETLLQGTTLCDRTKRLT